MNKLLSRHLFMSISLFILTILTLLVIRMEAIGPDIKNYMNSFNPDFNFLARYVFALLISWSRSLLDANLISMFFVSLLAFNFKLKNLHDIMVTYLLLMLFFFLSYFSSVLFGNIIRQGLASVLLVLALNCSSRLINMITLIFSTTIHLVSLPAFAMYNLAHYSYKEQLKVKYILFLTLMLAMVFTFYFDRISRLLGRNFIEDSKSFLFVFLLLLIRLALFKNYLITNNKIQNSFTTCGLFLLVFFGAYGQRVLISLIFILDFSKLKSSFRQTGVFSRFLAIWTFEAFFRYLVIGNFWTPSTFF